MKHPINSHRLVEEHQLHDLVEQLDAAVMLLEDVWADEDGTLSAADVNIYSALAAAADYLHQLHLQQTA
jgi:hypothetical protein